MVAGAILDDGAVLTRLERKSRFFDGLLGQIATREPTQLSLGDRVILGCQVWKGPASLQITQGLLCITCIIEQNLLNVYLLGGGWDGGRHLVTHPGGGQLEAQRGAEGGVAVPVGGLPG